MDHEVGLDLRDSRIVRQVRDVLRLLDVLSVVGRQAGDGALQFADRGQMFVEAMPVRLAERRQQVRQVLTHGVEHALLAPDPALVPAAKQPVEQILRDHLGRQRAVVPRPTQVAMDVLAVRLLTHADLQRAEPRLPTNRPGDDLVDGGPAGAAAGVRGS